MDATMFDRVALECGTECAVYATEHLAFYVLGGRCLAVRDRAGCWEHDHYAVDEQVGLRHSAGADGGSHYLRVAILGGHAHIGPLVRAARASHPELAALAAAAGDVDAGLSLRRWGSDRPWHGPAAA